VRPEDALQSTVRAFLDRAMPSAVWWTATANGAWFGGDKRRRMIQAARMKRTGVKSGTPDLIFCHDGRFLSIELKLPDTDPTDKQMEVEDQIAIAGGGYAICRGVDDVERQLVAWGVPLRGSLRVAA
jgi:hypothetical protein